MLFNTLLEYDNLNTINFCYKNTNIEYLFDINALITLMELNNF